MNSKDYTRCLFETLFLQFLVLFCFFLLKGYDDDLNFLFFCLTFTPGVEEKTFRGSGERRRS